MIRSVVGASIYRPVKYRGSFGPALLLGLNAAACAAGGAAETCCIGQMHRAYLAARIKQLP